MEKKMSVWRVICSVLIIIIMIPFISCAGCTVVVCSDPEGTLGRHHGYDEKEVLKILKIEYKKEFEIVSIEEHSYGNLYTVSPKEYPELIFNFYDCNDGIGGWYSYDDFGEQVLLYCAEKHGFETFRDTSVCLSPVIIIGGNDIGETAGLLHNTIQMYFEIFDYCKGNIKRYSSYLPKHTGMCTDFVLLRHVPNYNIPSNSTVCSSSYPYGNTLKFTKITSEAVIKSMLESYFD